MVVRMESHDTTHDAIPRRSAGAVAPTSFAQELLWLLDRSTPGLTAYNVPRAIEIRGALDAEALRLALSDVVARHEVLRTTYAAGEHGPIQVIHPARELALPLLDLSDRPRASHAAEVDRIVLEEARKPFDLADDELLRATLVRTAREAHTLVLVSHHIASDGWSKGVLYRDLSAAYGARAAGRAPELAPLPIQYADFAAWQRDAMQGELLESHLAFWRERLAAPLPVLELPTDFPRPAVQSFDGARQVMVLPPTLVTGLRELGMDRGATLYMVLLAAYQTVLHRYSGQDDVITGSPIAGRTRAETEGLIGYFANILAMRTSFAGDPTFGELLERIAEGAMDAFEHEEVPFEKLVLDLREGQEAPGHAPLFRCVLTMEDTLPDQLRFGNAEVRPYTIDYGQAKFDLTLLVAEQVDGLRLGLWYRTDLFTAAYAERFLGHLRTVLETAVANADVRVRELSLFTAAERAALDRWTATEIDEGEPMTLAALLERAMARLAFTHPDVTLVLAGPRRGIDAAEPAWRRTLGFVSDDDLVSLYRGARALLAPSSYEGFGLPVLEAMRLGTPVICARASSLPEVAGDAAAYVHPDDDEALAAIAARVVEDDALHARMRAAGLAQSARFSWEDTARRTLDAFDEAATMAGSSAPA
jgi:hypothetical protein